jgi:hypothetical protein
MTIPENAGKRFQIRVDGRRISAYYNPETRTVCAPKRGAWFHWSADTIEIAKDIITKFYQGDHYVY